MEQRISFLLQQRLEQKLTSAEAEELLAVLQNTEYDTLVTDKLEQLVASQPQGPAFDPVDLQRWVKGIVTVDKNLEEVVGSEAREGMAARPVHRINFLRTAWFRYAAVLLLLIGAGYLFYDNFYKGKMFVQLDPVRKPDVAPGGNKAVLTLADGSVIVLDSAANGLLSQQGNTKVMKSASGQLAYEAGGPVNVAGSGNSTASNGTGVVKYNTISIPRGGQYQIQLPDGSQVWLNSSSSLRFPTAFYGKSREVEITGEAYFEIAKDVNRPFYVKANKMSVEVLGTHFNINAYTDEPVVKATLLEGSVRVKKAGESVVMTPGQEAQVINEAMGDASTGRAMIKLINDADLEEAVAWKNGLFHLTSADVGTIMRQLVRWYDVDVEFEGGIPSGHITGEVPRNTSLAKVLKVFETSGVHFRIEGRKIIVTP
jgi:ferric-dicitrate binding protein FerR (iron transport regulator)